MATKAPSPSSNASTTESAASARSPDAAASSTDARRLLCRLGTALALLAAAATATTALSLSALDGGAWQSLSQWFSASETGAQHAAWLLPVRARVGGPFTLPPGVRVPPEYDGTKRSAAFECFSTRDYGVIARLAEAQREFCTDPVASIRGDEMVTSTYTHYELKDADLMATTFRHLRLDLRRAEIEHSQDGSLHDPRVRYAHNLSECSCATPQDHAHGAPRVWRFAFSENLNENYVACSARPLTLNNWTDGLEGEDTPVLIAVRHAVVLSRKEDHNPFAQLSALFNAWIALRAVSWPTDTTQLVYLDKGQSTTMDELQHALLAPVEPVIHGGDIHGRVLHLESALIAPFEASGPLHSHLIDRQPCHDNQLLDEFRHVALRTMSVSEAANTTDDYGKRVVTVISRRAFDGLQIPRLWTNEDEVLDRMRTDYGDEFAFRSLDFANMTMREQMAHAIESDVVIGMHGAGMVNVAWTRPGTLVVEIFPQRTYQWGARNLCQFLGCDWHEFRGGKDHRAVRDANPYDMDKEIVYDEWKTFVDPLLRGRLGSGEA